MGRYNRFKEKIKKEKFKFRVRAREDNYRE